MVREGEQFSGIPRLPGIDGHPHAGFDLDLEALLMQVNRIPNMLLSIQGFDLGLIEAAKRFDPDKGVKFITYAVWWVRQAIIHALSDQSGAFRLPQKQANLLYRIGKAQSHLRSELKRTPSTEEIAARIIEAEPMNGDAESFVESLEVAVEE